MGNRSVKRIIEKRLIRYLLSAVIFGIIYSILSLIDKGNVKIGIYVDHAADGWGMIDDFYFGQE